MKKKISSLIKISKLPSLSECCISYSAENKKNVNLFNIWYRSKYKIKGSGCGPQWKKEQRLSTYKTYDVRARNHYTALIKFNLSTEHSVETRK